MGIDWGRMLPELIGAGASAGGQIAGAKIAAGGYEKAGQLQAQSAQQQLNALLGMYGLARGERAPHRAVGVSALNTLQNWKPGGQNAFAPVDLSKFRPNQVDLPPQLSGMMTGGANAFSPGGGGFSDISTKGIQSRGSRIAGGALTGAGLGMTGAGLGNAFVGGLTKFSMPWMAAAGAGIGAIKGAFDNNNPDKNFATEGINRVGPWVWNTVMPAVKSGQMTPEEAEQAVNQTLGQWEQSMRQVPGFNEGVLARSVASQRQYLQPFFDQINQFRQGQGVA